MTNPLDTPVNDIDTAFPRVAPGVYEFRIDGPAVGSNQKGTGELLTVPLRSCGELTSTDGERLPAGFGLTAWVGLTPTGNRTEGAIAKDLALLAKSAGLLTATPRQLIENPTVLQDKIVKCKVSIQKETAEWPERNQVRFTL
jgi:hypothetical protein